MVSSRGSQPEPGGSEAAELDARIFALLIPAMLAVFLDPAMAVVDAGRTPRPAHLAHDLHAICTVCVSGKTLSCVGLALLGTEALCVHVQQSLEVWARCSLEQQA